MYAKIEYKMCRFEQEERGLSAKRGFHVEHASSCRSSTK